MGVNIKKFPYKEIRAGQKTVIEKLDKHWDNYRYFIMELPTGFGKSALAKTIAASQDQAFLLTGTKQLQDQYVKDFSDKDTVSIKGRANYPCAIEPSLNVECGPCTVDKELLRNCKERGTCHYYKTRDNALLANTALTSYQYFLYSTFCGKFWRQRDVLILDECHLLEQQLVQWATIRFSPGELELDYGITLSDMPSGSGFRAYASWLKEVQNKVTNKRTELFKDVEDLLGGKDPNSLSEEELEEILSSHSDYYKIDKLYKRFDIFFQTPDKNSWLVEKEGIELVLTPLKMADLFHRYVKQWGAKKVIFMSATILDMVGFCQNLGLKKENTAILRVESEFPPEKSPIYYKPCGSMSYSELDKTMPNIIQAVNIVLSKHPNEKGVIHTGNYRIAREIIDKCNDPRLIMKNEGESNESLLFRHSQSKEPTVVVSPSLTTGADLKDDLSRFQIIVKLPFLSLADSRVKARSEQDNSWYVGEMFRTFIQAAGRSTRSEDDWSTTYVLDKSFYYFVQKHIKWFPKQFIKRIVWK